MNFYRKKLRAAWPYADESGVALVVVLWIFIFLFVVAFEFSYSVRDEANAAHRFNDETSGYYLAIAGFEKGLYEILNQANQANARTQPPGQKPDDLFDGAWREEKLGGGSYRARFIDEAGKININRSDEGTLRRIFINLDIQEPRLSIIVDSILDWIDQDELHRANGAESDYYLTLSPSYSAKNGPLDTVDELLWVRGITPALFFGFPEAGGRQSEAGPPIALRDIFTVDSPVNRVNLRTASAEVIHAMTGISLEKTRAFVDQRKQASDKTMADLLPLLGVGASDAAVQTFIFTNPSVVTIQAEGQPIDSRMARRVKGVIQLGGGQRGYELKRWTDRDSG